MFTWDQSTTVDINIGTNSLMRVELTLRCEQEGRDIEIGWFDIDSVTFFGNDAGTISSFTAFKLDDRFYCLVHDEIERRLEDGEIPVREPEAC